MECKKCKRPIYQMSCQKGKPKICFHCDQDIPKEINIGEVGWHKKAGQIETTLKV